MAEMQFSPVRVTASTQDAAIEQALAMTGATREDIAVEVLETSDKGVTVRVRPRSDDDQNIQASREPEVTEPEGDAPEDDEPEIEEPEAEEEIEADEFDDEEDEDEEDEETEYSDDDADEEPAVKLESAAPAFDEATMQAAHERVEKLSKDWLERMDLDVECQSLPLPQWMIDPDDEPDVPRVYLKIEGEDVSILIGKRGSTLQSFQYLLNLTLNNREEGQEEVENGVHVMVDAGEYRERRAVSLHQSAREAAERAKRDRRSVRMEPLNGHERRLVHLALRGDSEVTTDSEGREPWRRVIVTPKNARGGESRGESRSEGRDSYGNADSGGRGGGSRGGYGSGRGGQGGGQSGGRGYGRGRQ